MPQFDKFTFFNQIFWLLSIFFGFYLIILRGYLPKISAVIKTRNKKLSKSSSLVEGFSTEKSSTFLTSSQLVASALSNEFEYISKNKEFHDSNSTIAVLSTVHKIEDVFNNSFIRIAVKKILI